MFGKYRIYLGKYLTDNHLKSNTEFYCLLIYIFKKKKDVLKLFTNLKYHTLCNTTNRRYLKRRICCWNLKQNTWIYSNNNTHRNLVYTRQTTNASVYTTIGEF